MGHASTVTRSADGTTLETNKRKRTVRAVWSDDSTDHYRTVFHQGGIDTSVFASNPIILFEHGKHPTRAGLPIGQALEWGVEKYRGRNALIGVTRFHEDEFSDARFEDYASGRLRGWSINALPVDASPPTREEARARPEWAQAETVFREVKLLEVSAVSLPGNAGTLTLSVERSYAAASRGRFSPSPALLARARADLESSMWAFATAVRLYRAGRASAEYQRLIVHRAGLSRKRIEAMSIEELEAEIKRLKLMKDLAELLDKQEQAEAHAKQAAAAEKMKAEYAAQCKGAG